jgi:hypothetical protein
MVDDKGSPFQEILAQIDPRGRKRLTAEFNRMRYHVFARAGDCELWIYIAAIHAKADALAVSVALVEGGLAVECVICVVAFSPDPRAGKLILVHREPRSSSGGQGLERASAECVEDDSG